MESLYSKEIQQAFRTRDWPRGLNPQIVEFEDCLKVLMYRERINRLDHDDKMHLAAVLNDFLTKIRNSGVPIYTWVDREENHNAK